MHFFKFFRCAELTIQQGFNPSCHLSCEDVKLHKGCITIFLKTSKTGHFNKGSSIILYSNDTNVCQVKSLCRYMQARQFCKAGPEEPFFIPEDNLPVTRSHFIEHLQHIMHCLGFDSAKYSGHPFRIGCGYICRSSSDRRPSH